MGEMRRSIWTGWIKRGQEGIAALGLSPYLLARQRLIIGRICWLESCQRLPKAAGGSLRRGGRP